MKDHAGLPGQCHYLFQDRDGTPDARSESTATLQILEATVKLAKCSFFDTAISYFGHTIRPGQPEVDIRNPLAIKQAKAPTSQTTLRFFLGACSAYRLVVPGFANTAAPLNEKTGKWEPFGFELLTETEFDAFRDLKRKLVSPPLLVPLCDGYKYTLSTGRCD